MNRLYDLLPGNDRSHLAKWVRVDQLFGDLAVAEIFLVTDEYFASAQTRF